ncbi:MAG: ABC transporter substrate-binding protein, partial [Candidatus Omnitrophica bacterium]|nr:ABC transporter substrate-binding protein [Candidatus Omnitrophota bacterium]
YRIIPDAATIFLELETGGADSSILTPLQFTRQTDSSFFRSKYNKFRYPGFGYTYMGYNLSDPRFSDIRVRKAIDYAVDKEEIVKTIFFGLGRVITGPFIADSWAYDKSVNPAPYDPARSKELLKDAGWSDNDGDGWIEK